MTGERLATCADDAVVRRVVLAAEVAFLRKPYAPDAVLERIREVLARPRGARAVSPPRRLLGSASV